MAMKRFLLNIFFLAGFLLPASAWAVGTGANTVINNTVNITYDTGAVTGLTVNASASFRVDEIIAATHTWQDAGNIIVLSPDSNQVLSFLLTNVGNGVETFALSVNNAIAGDNFDPLNSRIYLDNGNGVYDGTVTETLYVPGVNDPVLDANGTDAIVIFVLNDIPAALLPTNTGISRITASSTTPGAAGSPVGTVLAGQGDGGLIDAVVGTTTADVNANGIYEVQANPVGLVKSADVINDGSACTTGCSPIPSAIIRYTIQVNVIGLGIAESLTITDAIPVNTTYVAGTITLDAIAMTDIVDVDAGDFTANTVTINLGNVNAPATRTIAFDVTIN